MTLFFTFFCEMILDISDVDVVLFAKLLLVFGFVSLIICLTAEIIHVFMSDP